jgi:hypothetical protein
VSITFAVCTVVQTDLSGAVLVFSSGPTSQPGRAFRVEGVFGSVRIASRSTTALADAAAGDAVRRLD